MQVEQPSARTNLTEEQPSISASRGAGLIFFSPLVWGGLATVLFYQAIPYLPLKRELAVRYFCSHPLEYATTALFFVGLATLAIKAARTTTEKLALSAAWLDSPVEPAADLFSRLRHVEQKLQGLPPRLRRTYLGERIADVCAHLRGRQTTDHVEEHLRYLAELASERLHASYALVRTITWAVPILGFLGTVIGITIAIANVTPAQLETSLGDVTGGLAVAFDTTALALALSLVLVFASFVVERSEQQVLADVEDVGIKRIASLFPPVSAKHGRLIEAEGQAAEQLLQKTERLINWQTQSWQKSLDSLRERWMATLDAQQNTLEAALSQGVANTLQDHALQLEATRSEFLQGFADVGRFLSDSMAESQRQQRELTAEWQAGFVQLWRKVRDELIGLKDDGTAEIDRALSSASETAAAWQKQLEQHAEAADLQLVELRKQGELFKSIVDQEQQLTRLQTRLADNLEALRTSETFEQTLQSLSAAIHLLTARVKPKAA